MRVAMGVASITMSMRLAMSMGVMVTMPMCSRARTRRWVRGVVAHVVDTIDAYHEADCDD